MFDACVHYRFEPPRGCAGGAHNGNHADLIEKRGYGGDKIDLSVDDRSLAEDVLVAVNVRVDEAAPLFSVAQAPGRLRLMRGRQRNGPFP